MILNDRELVRLVDRLAGSIDDNRWELAKLASEARDAQIQDYAEIIARHPRVRRSPSTVRHWARVADFRQKVKTDAQLPFSCWETAARYEGRLLLEDIVEMLETFSAESGVGVEQLRCELQALTDGAEGEDWRKTLKHILPGLKKLEADVGAPVEVRKACSVLVEANNGN